MIGFVVAEVALAIAVGFCAQRWKGRTGAAWALITFVVEMAVLAFGVFSVGTHLPGEMARPEMTVALHLAALLSGLVMFGVVATLPAKARA